MHANVETRDSRYTRVEAERRMPRRSRRTCRRYDGSIAHRRFVVGERGLAPDHDIAVGVDGATVSL